MVLLAGALAGCTPPPPPVGDAQYDGEYVGQAILVMGGGYLCEPANAPLALAVRGGRFDYPFLVNVGRTAPVPVQVAADGSFAGQMQYGTEDYWIRSHYKNAWVTVRGRIADGALDATITDDRCVHRFTARRG
jgi:hypothetical protein